jgi:hypothetical protein
MCCRAHYLAKPLHNPGFFRLYGEPGGTENNSKRENGNDYQALARLETTQFQALIFQFIKKRFQLFP